MRYIRWEIPNFAISRAMITVIFSLNIQVTHVMEIDFFPRLPARPYLRRTLYKKSEFVAVCVGKRFIGKTF